jgi:hypothetical protein
MSQTIYHVICFGVLDEEDGTTYSLPYSYSDRDTADFRYRLNERKGKHEAVFLVQETGLSFQVVRCCGGDKAHLVQDAPGVFSLLSTQALV